MTATELGKKSVDLPSIHQVVRSIVCDLTDLSSEEVKISAHLQRDLGIDDLTRAEIIKHAEEYFDTRTEDHLFTSMVTCEWIARSIYNAIEGRRNEVFLKLFAKCYIKVTGVADVEIHPSMHLQLDLRLDSMTRLEIGAMLRDIYSLPVLDDSLCQFSTVADVVSYLKQIVRDV